MDKHRLELFSDCVFAIVLTLIVLELKSPVHYDLSGLWERAPSLLVHALAFTIFGLHWIMHHRLFATVHRVSQGMMLANLAALFWVSLMPLGARFAAEHPLEPLGAAILGLCSAGFGASIIAMRPYQFPDGVTPSEAERALGRASRWPIARAVFGSRALETLGCQPHREMMTDKSEKPSWTSAAALAGAAIGSAAGAKNRGIKAAPTRRKIQTRPPPDPSAS